MNIFAAAQGLIRGGLDVIRNVTVGPLGDVKSSKFLPDYAQLCAEGRVWRAQEATATAAVTALPTDAALYTIGNNEPDDGLWYVVLAVTAFNAANAAAFDSFALAGCLSQLPALTGGISTTLAQDLAKTTIKNLGGTRNSGYNGRAILDTGVTIVDDDWFPISNASGSTGVNSSKGVTMWHWLHGIIILPPKTLFAMVATATSASNTTRKGLVWAEVPKNYLLAA